MFQATLSENPAILACFANLTNTSVNEILDHFGKHSYLLSCWGLEKETVIDHLIQLSTREGISMFPKMPRHFHRVIVKLIYKMLNCFVVFVIKDVQVRKKSIDKCGDDP